jgi:hypothetical protein
MTIPLLSAEARYLPFGEKETVVTRKSCWRSTFWLWHKELFTFQIRTVLSSPPLFNTWIYMKIPHDFRSTKNTLPTNRQIHSSRSRKFHECALPIHGCNLSPTTITGQIFISLACQVIKIIIKNKKYLDVPIIRKVS